MLEYSNTMNLNHFNDFYYLEALKTDIKRRMTTNKELQFKHSVVKLLTDAEMLFDEIAPNLAFRTFVYLWAACLGEARHARESLCKHRFLKEINKSERRDVYEITKQFPPTRENIKAVIDVFSDKWSGSFGGQAWRNIAEALYFYEKDPTTFIDHVIDLQHNTGTVFNKSEARYTIGFEVDYDGSLNDFLSYKFSRDILSEDFHRGIKVSREVYVLVKRHNVIFFGKDMSPWLEAAFHILPDYGFKWGKRRLTVEEKWSDFANVTKSNKPDAHQLKDKIWAELVTMIWMNKDELRKRVKDEFNKYACTNKAKAIKQVFKEIDEAKEFNENKMAMVACAYQNMEQAIKVRTQYGYSMYPKKDSRYSVQKEHGYLTLEKGVLYLHGKEGKVELKYRTAPYWIKNVEEECIK